mmetsp:Transcript_111732/g.216445  ORF Transcript_111732/g.216445 Transcript_111732/m.216445 type:complete len:223 (+) Transcript_111732:132-800(+)
MSKPHEHYMGQACGCMPLRPAVGTLAGLLLGVSLCAVASLITEDVRFLAGGYSLSAHNSASALGAIGVVISIGALVGIGDNTSRWVRPFAVFLLLRIIAVLVIFAMDWEVLSGCERFTINGKEFSSMIGRYNPAIETVALSNTCQQARSKYVIRTVLEVILGLYGTIISFRWCHVVDTVPTYQISLDENRPLRMYTGYRNLGYPNAPQSGPPPSTFHSSHYA